MKPGIALFLLLASLAGPARAHGPFANADSVYLIGTFVDPVCFFQHRMTGATERECAAAPGRAAQGMGFYDLRRREYFSVIGETVWRDPRAGFLDALGDTFAVRGHVWRRGDAVALVVEALDPVDRQPAASFAWWPWSWHLSVVAGCAAWALLYLYALGPARRRLGGGASRFERGRAALFLGGLVVVLLSLNGPIHDLSDFYLFWPHMVQHLLLAQVFPLLFLLGLPPWLTRRLLRPRAVARAWAFFAGVPMGFILSTAVFSIWHVPVLYDLMMRNHDFHVLMHLMVMATAILMWWPIVGGEAARSPLSVPARMLYLFLLGIPMMAVAAPLVFAARPLYEWYALAPRLGGLSALDDQRLGALIMWIPGGLFYWGVMSVLFFRWSAREEEPEPPLLPRPA